MELIASRRDAFSFMGRGYRIRVPKAPQVEPGMLPAIELRDGLCQREGKPERPRFALDPRVFENMKLAHDIFCLTEETEDSRLGWREAGYDGDVADWWVLMQ